MKLRQYFFTVALSCVTFISCNNTESNEQRAGEMNEGEMVQTEENIDMQEVKRIEVVAENMQYKPNELRAKPGQQMEVTLINKGKEEHNIEFELPDGEQELETPVKPGNRATLTLVAPEQPGTYTIYCPVDNHRQKGMTGKLIVE